jgi:hypothetical protein
MTTLLPIIPTVPETGEADGAGEHLVGVAVIGALRGFESPIAAAMLAEKLATRMGSDGIEWKNCGSLAGAGFLCCLGLVKERDRALVEIEEVLMRAGFWPGFELAYYDTGDLAWRTVYPQPAKNFGRFGSPEALRSNARSLEIICKLLKLPYPPIEAANGKQPEA